MNDAELGQWMDLVTDHGRVTNENIGITLEIVDTLHQRLASLERTVLLLTVALVAVAIMAIIR